MKLQNIPGFVKFICIYRCYDNSTDKLPEKICQALVIFDENKKLVILENGQKFLTSHFNALLSSRVY